MVALRVAAMVIRADKQGHAAMKNLDTWHSQKLSHCPQCRFPIANSSVGIARRALPLRSARGATGIGFGYAVAEHV